MQNDIKFYSCFDEPFKIYGLYKPSAENGFIRIPQSVADCLEAPLFKEQQLHKNTAGGRVRFRTDAKSITIRAKLDRADYSGNCNVLLRRNFDLYKKQGNRVVFETTFVHYSEESIKGNFLESSGLSGAMSEYTLYLPCYGNVYSLEIGFPEDAKVLAPTDYSIDKPIVFLGSSITQGGCAQRPGLQYQALISRDLDADFINLGFSGSCRAEKELMEYIAAIPMSAFVYDYDHNTPTVEHLEESHLRGYKIIRKANPDLPIVLVTRPDLNICNKSEIEYRIIIQKTYHYGIENGDKNLYYIDGYSFFAGNNYWDHTVDKCHPNDVGMFKMAEVIADTLNVAIYKQQKNTRKIIIDV